ncbi:MAG: T9SS type A sorting domain-containing protein [Sphingobacteriales bacterium]|nr:MAG: T9SS type A sorting domain-containing protein [Sphingobacteriales bacterium]
MIGFLFRFFLFPETEPAVRMPFRQNLIDPVRFFLNLFFNPSKKPKDVMKIKYLRFLIPALLLLILQNAAAQPLSILWQRTLGGEMQDKASAIKATSDGGYLVAGASASGVTISSDKQDACRGVSDFWLIKLAADGSISWQKTIGGSAEDVPANIVEVAGGYLISGKSQSGISGEKTDSTRDHPDFPSSDCWLIKINLTGAIQWQKTLGGSYYDGSSFYGSFFPNMELSTSNSSEVVIQPANDGGYIMGASSGSPVSGDKTQPYRGNLYLGNYLFADIILSDYWLVKMNATGGVQWQKTYGGELYDMLTSVTNTSDGGYLLGGYSASNAGNEKADSNRSGSWLTLNAFYADSVAHFEYLYYVDYWIVKTNSQGDIQWQTTIGGDSMDVLQTVIPTADGGYLLGGSSNSNQSGEKTDDRKGGTDYWIVKLSSNGKIDWQQTIGGAENDVLASLSATGDGGYLLAGTSWSGISGDKTSTLSGISDFWLVKTDSLGNIQWQQSLGGANELQPDVLANAFTKADGSILVAGSSDATMSGNKSETSRGNYDYWLLKLCDLPDTSITIQGNTLQATGTATAYQWIDCTTGTPVAGATQSSFQPADQGVYAVILHSSCGADTSSCYSTNGTEIKETAATTDIRIFPNPADDRVTIRSDRTPFQGIRLISMTGQLVYEEQFTGRAMFTFRTAALAPGVYQLTVHSETGKSQHKLTVIH